MKKITLFHPGTRHPLFLLLTTMCLLIAPQSVFSATIFVDAENGTDIHCINGCNPSYYRTWATACATIDEAYYEITERGDAGRDTIVVRGDILHDNTLCTGSGTPWACCTGNGSGNCIESYSSTPPEDDVTITGAWKTGDPASYQTCDDNPTYVVNLDGTLDFNNDLPNGAIIQCFDISGGSPAMYMSASSATAIDHNTIFRKNKVGPSSGKPCIKWEGGSPIIEDNEFTGCVRPAIRFIGDAGTSTYPAIIRNNDFHGNSTSGSSGIYNTEIYFEDKAPSQWVLIQDNLIHNNMARAGINFEAGDHNVHITGNQIYGNPFAAIHVSTEQTGQITISGEQNFTFAGGTQADYGNGSPNIIRDNQRGGIVLAHNATMDIISNDIYDNQWGGISTDEIDPNTGYPNYDGFYGDLALNAVVLNIRKNYIHGNGKALNTIGGGINVRAATATITNNVIYKNNRAGIRVGDFVQEISNNTLVANGKAGIAYDSQINTCLDCGASGTLASPIPVKNNVIAYNVNAAFKGLGFANSAAFERDYNLLYANNQNLWFMTEDCYYVIGSMDYKCLSGQYSFNTSYYVDKGNASCTASFNPYPCCTGVGTGTCLGDRKVRLMDPHDMLDDPLFVSMTAGSEDYQLDTGSPGIGAGEGGTDMGAWGGADPMDWLHGLPH